MYEMQKNLVEDSECPLKENRFMLMNLNVQKKVLFIKCIYILKPFLLPEEVS